MPLTEDEKTKIGKLIRLKFIEKPDMTAIKTFISTYPNQEWLTLVDAIKKVQEAKGYAADVLRELAKGGTKELGELGIDAISVASERHAPPRYRVLDGLARVIAAVNPKQTCVAVCVEPRYQRSLLVASNGRSLQKGAVQQLLNQVATDEIPFGEENQHLSELSAKRGALSSDDRATYVDLRAKRDRAKLGTAAHNMLRSLRVEIIIGGEFEHAELQLLDYIETTIFGTGGVSRTLPLYMGVSLRCCGKCQTVIDYYNSCGFNHVRIVTRGVHPTYDFRAWRCPEGAPMTADLSDDEGEYVSRQHRI